ncbi:hypothetical protein EVAR_100283_1 [Eumeta japonica]|uniref:Uncharacterized protein n=1 Tax=Eumeta variegata TaxID=151549 RepID=A0A4C2A7W6_EUMVA|nr:hypothetical protein EVAR_100283_1 [Eumeta japonica]
MESNLQTSCLTKPSTADRPAVVPSAVPAIPSAGLSSLSAFGLPGLITTASGVFSPSVTHISGLPTLYPCKIDSKTVPLMFKTPKPSATTSDPDKDVLNNLAIALQLLIVSNLMKAPITN